MPSVGSWNVRTSSLRGDVVRRARGRRLRVPTDEQTRSVLIERQRISLMKESVGNDTHHR